MIRKLSRAEFIRRATGTDDPLLEEVNDREAEAARDRKAMDDLYKNYVIDSITRRQKKYGR